MEFITIFLIAISLALDAFAVSVSNGIAIRNFGVRDALRQGWYFGAFQFFMPVAGYILGASISSYIEAFDHWIAFVLLALIGGNMVIGCLKSKEESECACLRAPLTVKEIVMQAVATSIDAMAVGVGLAILNVNILFAATVIGVVAFVLSYGGGMLGKRLGSLFQKRAELFGGIILIGIGVKIVVEHLMG